MARRKFKVRVRGKVRNRLLRRGGAAAGIALGLGMAVWMLGAAAQGGRRLLEARFQFRPEAFDIKCPAEEAAASIRALTAGALNRPFGARRAEAMEREIRELHPGLASVEVSRNFLTRKASVAAVPEEVVSAVISDGTLRYLGVTGRFMPERLAGPEEDPFRVELHRSPGSAPELASFLAGLRPLAGLFYSRPVLLSCDGQSWDCRFELEDGSEVLWGKFEFTRLKILRLNEVMGDALQRSGGPLRADLRSFSEGKIFVSAPER